MTRTDDFIGQVESYLEDYEGSTPLPEAVRDAIRAELPLTRQRPAWWPARRFPEMSNFAKLSVAAAVVVVAALLSFNYLVAPNVGSDGDGLDDPSPTPSPSPGPTPQDLPEGSHVLWNAQSEPGSVPMTVTIPAAGWFGSAGGGQLTKNESADPPDGAGMIVWAGIENVYVYGDPCEWSSTLPDTPATTVDEVVAALGAQASRDASAPVDITVGGYAGKAITLHVPDDANFAECDQGLFSMFSERVATDRDSVERYAQGPGQIDEVWILDVDGRMVLIDWTYYDGTPLHVVDELRAIVESATFD
jgi:hypothetical protein